MLHPRRRLTLGALSLVVALAIGAAITWFGAPAFDARLVEDARALRDGATGGVSELANDVAYGRWLAPFGIVLGLLVWIRARRWRHALLLATATLTATFVTQALKLVFERPRPAQAGFLVDSFAMPSGHATSSAAFAASIVLAVPAGRARAVALAVGASFALVVGASRVVLGVHFPTDVLAGWLLGVGIALVLAGALRVD